MQEDSDGGNRGVRWAAGATFSIIPEWVIDADITATAVRLYAVLARYADGRGEAFPSRRTLGQRAKCSVATVDRALDELEEIGAIEVVQRERADGGATSNLYLLCGSPSSPVRTAPLLTNEEGKGTRETPSNERELAPYKPPTDLAVALPSNRPTTVAKKRVTDAEYELAAATLAAFNTRAGTRFQSLPDIERIIRRIREYPELGFEAHVAIILAVFVGKHWWDEPAPRIIYGNASIFESSLHLAAKPPDPNRPMTSDEIRALGRKLAEDENVIDGEAVEVGS